MLDLKTGQIIKVRSGKEIIKGEIIDIKNYQGVEIFIIDSSDNEFSHEDIFKEEENKERRI